MDTETIAACALNTIFGFQPRLGQALLDAVGSAGEIFRLSRDSLRSLTGPSSQWLSQLTPSALERAEKELDAAAKEGARFIPLSDPDFPALLRECEDPPMGLYFKSSDSPGNVFGGRPAIAIVGTRDMDSYGREWCQRLVEALASCREKPVIVSGLALGVDGCAHQAALDAGLPTIAVMATGIDRVYPFRHGLLASRIACSPGCALLTDYPTGTAPIAIHFLRRNRIIAGLSVATVLIESKKKGGGMLTAQLASSYGRALYALPGRADDTRSQGCNILIRQQLAEAVTDPESFIQSLGLGPVKRKVRDIAADAAAFYADEPDDSRRRLLAAFDFIRKHRECGAEELASALGCGFPEASAAAARLESDGFIATDIMGRCSIRIK